MNFQDSRGHIDELSKVFSPELHRISKDLISPIHVHSANHNLQYCTNCLRQEGDFQHSISQCPQYLRYVGAKSYMAICDSLHSLLSSVSITLPPPAKSKSSRVRNQSMVNSPIPIYRARSRILEPLALNAHLENNYVFQTENGRTKPLRKKSKPYLPTQSATLSGIGGPDVQSKDEEGLAGRSQSLGSILDYGTPTQWIRRLLKQPKSYTPQFTTIPNRDRSSGVTFVDARRYSDQTFLSGPISRRQTAKSVFSAKSGYRIDSFGFKRAMSDLERLLSEALNLASQVIDRSEVPSQDQQSQTPHHRLAQSNSDAISSGEESFASAQEDAEDFSDIDLDENQPHLKRPGYKHATTYCGSPERPRLAEIAERYSGTHDEGKARSLKCECCRDSATGHIEEAVPLCIPYRRSSKYFTAKDPRGNQRDIRQGNCGSLSREPEAYDDDLTSTTTEVVDFNAGKENHRGGTMVSRNIPNQRFPTEIKTSGTNSLPQHSGTDHKKHHKHGINLRRRSHVSLQNAQGFSLVKSHKRHPIARD